MHEPSSSNNLNGSDLSSPQNHTGPLNVSTMEDVFSKPMTPEMLQMMMTYLRRHGLSETEESLSREAPGLLKAGLSASNGLPPDEALSVEFDTFVQHFNSLTDVVQAEFSQLLFPVFAHSYFSLIGAGVQATARSFFERFKCFIPECYAEYVHELSRIDDAISLKASDCFHTLTDNHFVVKMSKACTKQLELVTLRLRAVKNIIAKNVLIEQTDVNTKFRSTIEAQMGGILGQTSKNDKRHKMFYGVVKDDLMVQIEKKKMKGKESRDAGKKIQSVAPAADRIPLPPLSEYIREEKRNHQREVSKMTIVSAESPVSICMYTTLNSPFGIASSDFSDDSSFVAMGMSDSTIVINAMNPMSKLRKLHSVDVLEKIDMETAENIQELMFDADQSAGNLKFTGHGAPVFSVNFSPDKRLLLSSSGDKTVRLWSLEVQKNVVVYRTPTVIWDAQFCNRGYYFATGGADKMAAVWCTDRMQPIRMFAEAFGDVGCVDFHPNCNYVAGGSDDRYVRVWDMLQGTCVRSFSGHKGNVIAVKFSPDGRYLVSVDSAGNVLLWDLAYQRLLAVETTEQTGTKGSIAFTRDGGAFAVSHGNSNISVYSLDAMIANMAANAQNDFCLDPKINMDGFNIGTYPTKQTPVIGLHFTRRNLLMALGCFGQ
ncbi:unnamed protein product [Caenorhabditis bovis]|uniref:TFIID subunit TAF5 NTD2 domain-containing protein n=1 Tax=Caenorhabditis bovis TaxID=2654633 RepID=A0A8S1FBP4_9PELO|nr:unnamed protein product [Caenorhabditis bovis]